MRVAGYSMDYMIRLNIIYPFAIIDFVICRVWGWQKSKVGNDLATVLNDKTTIPFQISRNDCLRGIAISPLVHIAGLPHNLLRSIHNLHNINHVCRLGFSDNPTHRRGRCKSASSVHFRHVIAHSLQLHGCSKEVELVQAGNVAVEGRSSTSFMLSRN